MWLHACFIAGNHVQDDSTFRRRFFLNIFLVFASAAFSLAGSGTKSTLRATTKTCLHDGDDGCVISGLSSHAYTILLCLPLQNNQGIIALRYTIQHRWKNRCSFFPPFADDVEVKSYNHFPVAFFMSGRHYSCASMVITTTSHGDNACVPAYQLHCAGSRSHNEDTSTRIDAIRAAEDTDMYLHLSSIVT